jgi:hypothetical protein
LGKRKRKTDKEYIDMLILLMWGCRREFIEVGIATKTNPQGCLLLYIFLSPRLEKIAVRP